MNLENLAFEEQVQVRAMHEAYDYGLPVSAVRAVYASLKKVSEQNNLQPSDSLAVRVNDIIKTLTVGYNGRNAFILKCEQVDNDCFDAMYRKRVARDLYVENLIRLIMENPTVSDPKMYVGLLDSNALGEPDEPVATGTPSAPGTTSSLSWLNNSDTANSSGWSDSSDIYISKSELQQKIQEITDAEFERCVDSEDLIRLVMQKINQCSTQNIRAFQ